MHQMKYRITTQSPIIISKISGDVNMIATEKYIPGTVVLGLLAKRFINKNNMSREAHKNKNFYDWFLSGSIKISNAYIFSQDEYGDQLIHYPTPLSIVMDKNNDTKDVYDRLFSSENISKETKSIGDFCFLKDGTLQTRAVTTEINFHHARDREKGVSREGKIFNYESVNAEQVFEGVIHGQENDLQNLLGACGDNWPALIGRSKNSQYGVIKFEITDKKPMQLQHEVDWLKHKNNNEDDIPEKCISMTLISDLILYNDYGYPTTDTEDLQKTLQQHLGEVEVIKTFAKKTDIENFVGIWRLKKPSEVCFIAGSTFLLKGSREQFKKKLAEMQEIAIGERTHEGFGQCAFNLQVIAKLRLRDEIEEEEKDKFYAQKPKEPPTGVVKTIVEKVIRKTIREHIALDAINKLENFEQLPSSSLISKLYAMAENATNRNDMFTEVINLQKPAVDQLKKCKNDEYTLMEYLAAFQLSKDVIDELKSGDFDTERKKQVVNKEFVLIQDLWEYLKPKIDKIAKSEQDKFTEEKKKLIMKYAKIQNEPIVWDEFFRQIKHDDIKTLCGEIGFKPEDDIIFKDSLTKVFYTTFFGEMRKRKIAERGDENDK